MIAAQDCAAMTHNVLLWRTKIRIMRVNSIAVGKNCKRMRKFRN